MENERMQLLKKAAAEIITVTCGIFSYVKHCRLITALIGWRDQWRAAWGKRNE